MVNLFGLFFMLGIVADVNGFPLRDYGTSVSSSTYYIGRFPAPPHMESSSNIMIDSQDLQTSATMPPFLSSAIRASSPVTVSTESEDTTEEHRYESDDTATTPVDGRTIDDSDESSFTVRAGRTTSPPRSQLGVLSTTYTTSLIEPRRSRPTSTTPGNSFDSDSDHVTDTLSEESPTSEEFVLSEKTWSLESTDDDYTETIPTTRDDLETSTAVTSFTTIFEHPTTVFNLNSEYTTKQTTIVDRHTSTVPMEETTITGYSETTPIFRSSTLPVIETTKVEQDSQEWFTQTPEHSETTPVFGSTTLPVIETTKVALDSQEWFTQTPEHSETTPVFGSTTLPVIETTKVALDSQEWFTQTPEHTTTDVDRDSTAVVDQDSDSSTSTSALEDRDTTIDDDHGSDSSTSPSTLEEYTAKSTTVHEVETTPLSLGEASSTDIEPNTETFPYQETTIASPKHHRHEMDHSYGTATTTDHFETTVSSILERGATSTKSHFVDILLKKILKNKFAKTKTGKQKYLQNPMIVTTKLDDVHIRLLKAILRSRHHK